jgi:hypothetical protein
MLATGVHTVSFPDDLPLPALLQADCLPDPGDVFLYLRVRGFLHACLLAGCQSESRFSHPPLNGVPAASHQMCFVGKRTVQEKDIGRDFALYYEAYATYFELRGNFQSADAVYMDGVQR